MMRPKHGWALVHMSILLTGLLLTCHTEASDEDSGCSQKIIVRRHTLYEAKVGQTLRINCPVLFCNDTPPTVSWYKNYSIIPVNNHINKEWHLIKKQEGVSVLNFRSINSSDSGRYICQTELSMGNAITLHIYDDKQDNRTINNKNRSSLENCTDFESGSTMWTYVYSAAGTASVVITVIIVTVALLRGCKGRSKKEAKNENLYIHMEERPFTHRTPKGSPSVTPSAQKKTTLMQQKRELVSTNEARLREEKKLEKETSIVYAAINHQLLSTTAGARRQDPKEEPTVYAALRVA